MEEQQTSDSTSQISFLGHKNRMVGSLANFSWLHPFPFPVSIIICQEVFMNIDDHQPVQKENWPSFWAILHNSQWWVLVSSLNYKHQFDSSPDSEKSCWLSELTSWILIGLVVFLSVACIFSSIWCFRSVVSDFHSLLQVQFLPKIQ